MMKYDTLLGHEFKLGERDCYTIVREFYKMNFDIELPNYARPTNFWSEGMDMYMERYHRNGFRPLDVHPSEYRPGDVVLMAIQSTVANHAGVLVENGRMLHHLYNQLSCVTPYRAMFRNTTVAVLRHKDVNVPTIEGTSNIRDYLPPAIRRKVDAALEDYQRSPSEV